MIDSHQARAQFVPLLQGPLSDFTGNYIHRLRPLIKLLKELDQEVKDNVIQALWHGSTGEFLLQPWMKHCQVKLPPKFFK